MEEGLSPQNIDASIELSRSNRRLLGWCKHSLPIAALPFTDFLLYGVAVFFCLFSGYIFGCHDNYIYIDITFAHNHIMCLICILLYLYRFVALPLAEDSYPTMNFGSIQDAMSSSDSSYSVTVVPARIHLNITLRKRRRQRRDTSGSDRPRRRPKHRHGRKHKKKRQRSRRRRRSETTSPAAEGSTEKGNDNKEGADVKAADHELVEGTSPTQAVSAVETRSPDAEPTGAKEEGATSPALAAASGSDTLESKSEPVEPEVGKTTMDAPGELSGMQLEVVQPTVEAPAELSVTAEKADEAKLQREQDVPPVLESTVERPPREKSTDIISGMLTCDELFIVFL